MVGVVDDLLFKAIADGTRRTILDELHDRDGQTLFELCARLTMRHRLGFDIAKPSHSTSASSNSAGLVHSRRREGRDKFHHSDTRPLHRDRLSSGRSLTLEREPHRCASTVASVLVDDQDKALRFYTDVLGFVKKTESPWVSPLADRRPRRPDGVELLLEPTGIPRAPFKGALSRRHPTHVIRCQRHRTTSTSGCRHSGSVHAAADPDGGGTTAVFEDTCGNLIQVASPD